MCIVNIEHPYIEAENEYEDGKLVREYFYAVIVDENEDWGFGSSDWDEACNMLLDYDSDYENKGIAVISIPYDEDGNDGDPFCEDFISGEEIEDDYEGRE